MSALDQLPRSQRRDPVRPGGRLRVRVNVSPRKTHIPGVHGAVSHGVQEVVIHERDLPKVKAMVEDRLHVLEQARLVHERKLREHIADRLRVKPEAIPSEDEWSEDMRKAAGVYPGHPLTVFRELEGRGVLPLIPIEGTDGGVEVVEELPGETSRDVAMARQIVEQMSGGQSSGALAAMQMQLTEQARVIEELRQELNRRKGGRPRKTDTPAD